MTQRVDLRALAIAGLLGTLGLGVALRWALAGVPLPWGVFTDLRHAHSHLGYYGALFPLMWWGWDRLGAPAPGPRTLGLYAAAVAVASAGFAAEGYGPAAIAGSTVVLAIWLLSAARLALWRPGRRGLGWLSAAPLGVLMGAVLIPPVAVTASRDPALSAQLAHTFLSLLTLGALTPTALASLDTPPPPAAGWLLAALAGALFLGPVHTGLTGLGLALLGLALGRSLWGALRRGRAPDLALALWAGAAAAMGVLGLRLLPYSYPVAIAGVHFLLLGPVLVTLARPLWRHPPPAWAGRLYTVVLAGFCASIALQAWPTGLPLPTAAACLGSVLAASWALALLLQLRAISHTPM